MSVMSQMLEIIDDHGMVTGLRPRSECHNNPNLLHRAVHVMVTDSRGRILLQKRSRNKDIQPGKWDTSVGGHVDPGETLMQAALRELKEELGISGVKIKQLYGYRHTTDRESEEVATFHLCHNGPFTAQPDEIDELCFKSRNKIRSLLGSGTFTSNFEMEFEKFSKWIKDHGV